MPHVTFQLTEAGKPNSAWMTSFDTSMSPRDLKMALQLMATILRNQAPLTTEKETK
jgi:hypothetical protein